MHIAVCDDGVVFQKQINDIIKKHYNTMDYLVDTYSSGRELLNNIKKESKYQLIFLDVDMPQLSGIEVAKAIRKLGLEVYIIFITSHEEFVYEGYEVEAFRYLLKPIEEGKIIKAIELIKEKFSQQEFLKLKIDYGEELIEIQDICYVEARNVKVLIVTDNKEYTVRGTLKEYEQRLLKDYFYKCHRSYLVNFKHIRAINENDFILDNGHKVPISRMLKKVAKENFYHYLVRAQL